MYNKIEFRYNVFYFADYLVVAIHEARDETILLRWTIYFLRAEEFIINLVK